MKENIPVTIRRDDRAPLKFDGESIGSATRRRRSLDNDGKTRVYDISAELFKTTGGKYVFGVEVYNRTDKAYQVRDAWIAGSIKELVELLAPLTTRAKVENTNPIYELVGWLGVDLLAEVFEHTEAGDSFVERID